MMMAVRRGLLRHAPTARLQVNDVVLERWVPKPAAMQLYRARPAQRPAQWEALAPKHMHHPLGHTVSKQACC